MQAQSVADLFPGWVYQVLFLSDFIPERFLKKPGSAAKNMARSPAVKMHQHYKDQRSLENTSAETEPVPVVNYVVKMQLTERKKEWQMNCANFM
ncbi:MAG: hypothetical protein IPQ16_14985 [Geobacteraceae bacterium]|nr:hypothetical protein [Geobacteraceae bacterium]